MKTSTHYRLSDEALAAIEKIGEATGLSATAVVEMTVREAAKRMDIRDRLGKTVTSESIKAAVEDSDDGIAEGYEDAEHNALGAGAKAKRNQAKAEKSARKAELRESVGKAVANPPARAARYAGRAVQIKPEIVEAEKEQTGTRVCAHPSQYRTSGKNWKCTACGYRKP